MVPFVHRFTKQPWWPVKFRLFIPNARPLSEISLEDGTMQRLCPGQVWPDGTQPPPVFNFLLVQRQGESAHI
jgi:hypothetical protein